jgi:hypothetical protein
MPEASLFAEKRVFPRFAIKIPIKYRVIEDQTEIKSILERGKKDQRAETADVSLSGLYVVAEQALIVKSLLRVDMSLNGDGSSITAFAEVVWANETGGGLRFLTMKDEDSEKLKPYLEKISSS